MPEERDPSVLLPYCQLIRTLYDEDRMEVDEALYLLEAIHGWAGYEVNESANVAYLEHKL